MKSLEFEATFLKMKNRWPKFFNEDMEEQVYSVCYSMTQEYFSKRINEAIWNNHPPKIDWFHAIVSDFNKFQSPITLNTPKEIETLPDSIFDESAVRSMFKMLREKQSGRVNNEDWKIFIEYVTDTAKKSSQKENCERCHDKGFVWRDRLVGETSYIYSYRCNCTYGRSINDICPIWEGA